ncbi:MAG: hypothetical protein ACREAZ_11095 [Nitrososphaera sp.]
MTTSNPMKSSHKRAISVGTGIAMVAIGTYFVTVAGLVAPYSLPLFTVIFLAGITLFAYNFVNSEILIGRLERRIEKLEKETKYLKESLGLYDESPKAIKK